MKTLNDHSTFILDTGRLVLVVCTEPVDDEHQVPPALLSFVDAELSSHFTPRESKHNDISNQFTKQEFDGSVDHRTLEVC